LLDLRSRAAGALREFGRLRRELETLEAGRREAERRLDLLRFQVGEIESALLQPDEEEDLAAERNLLVNAERLTQLSQGAREALVERAVGAIGEAAGALRDLSAIDPALAPLAERVASAQYDLDDVADELRRYGDRVEFDPQRLGAIEERLDLLMRLKRKYGATVAEVIEFGMQARAELEDVENLDERLAALSEAVSRAEEGAGSLAEALSRARASAARGLTEAMRAALGGLGLKSTEFRVEVMQTETDTGIGMPGSGRRLAFTQSGVDAVAFLVSFNPGEELRPLDRVASGGETSRFLLALKSVLAGADRTPTLVFDEVDVGIGGRHGTVVGERLRALARTHQVLSITHLPQVAALGDQHLSVSKAVRDGRTTVGVRSLEGTDRVVEIAEMMSGTGSETARRNAQELLEAARSGQ
jgi:DNA repair protein RecN (Recombination protein N)